MTLSAKTASRQLTSEPASLPLQGEPLRRLIQGFIAIFLIVACAAPYLFGHLIAFVLVACLAAALIFRFTLPPVALWWTITLASLGAFGVLHGSIAGYEGALSTASVLVVEPLLLGLLLPMAYRSEADITRLFRVLDIALLVVAGLGFLLYVNTITGLHLPIAQLIDSRFVAVDISGDTLRTNYQGYNSLVFLAPYAFFRCLASNRPGSASNTRRIVLGVAALSGILLAGRQMLYLSTPLAVLLAWALTRQPRTASQPASKLVGQVLRLVIVAGVLGLSLSALGLSVQSTISRTMSQFTVHDDSNVRTEQSGILLRKWLESPVFGHGAGVTTHGYVRDPKAPWSYEMTYHVLLMTFGLVGLIVLVAWAGWILKQLKTEDTMTQLRNRCIIAGFLGAVFASYADPYFLKLDGIWMAFIPFAVAVASHRPHTSRGVL